MGKIRLSRYLYVISLGIAFFLFECSPLLALDEYSNKTKMKKAFSVGQKEMEYEFSHKAKYDFAKADWVANEYASELAIDLIKHLKGAVEYKYIDKKGAKDGEELESKLEVSFEIPFEIELKDENKFVIDIRRGEQVYENELELCKEVARFGEDRALSLLVGDKGVYDFQSDEWTENEVFGGVELALSKTWKFQVKYCYVDVIDSPDDSEQVETELTFSF